MKKILLAMVIIAGISGCKSKTNDSSMEVSGKVENSPSKWIYLDEIPMATMQRTTIDSAEIGKDGNYKLTAPAEEARVYSLRLANINTPIADLINDAKSIKIDITFNKENGSSTYTTKGSKATEALKEFLLTFNSQLQSIYLNDLRMDSLQKSGAGDSILAIVNRERMNISQETKNKVLISVNQLINPALSMLELGYYQGTANVPGYKLQPISNEEVSTTINSIAVKFPEHQGLALIKRSMDEEMNASFVGKQAPDFTIPDINGKPVSLASFQGKYVLVDFWASWCLPCRQENPNVVAAYSKFKGKNFEILGVSFDREGEKDKWLEAIKADNLTWNHVSDLQYFNSPVATLYKLKGIPFNVLIDPRGKVIAQNLMGQDLESKLAEVLR